MDRLLLRSQKDGENNQICLLQCYDGINNVSRFQVIVNDKIVVDSDSIKDATNQYLLMVSNI